MIRPKKRRLRLKHWALSLMLVAAGSYIYWIIQKPLPTLQPEHSAVTLSSQSQPPHFAWPDYGEAAVALDGSKQIDSHGQQATLPIASVAKVISALCILQQK